MVYGVYFCDHLRHHFSSASAKYTTGILEIKMFESILCIRCVNFRICKTHHLIKIIMQKNRKHFAEIWWGSQSIERANRNFPLSLCMCVCVRSSLAVASRIENLGLAATICQLTWKHEFARVKIMGNVCSIKLSKQSKISLVICV